MIENLVKMVALAFVRNLRRNTVAKSEVFVPRILRSRFIIVEREIKSKLLQKLTAPSIDGR